MCRNVTRSGVGREGTEVTAREGMLPHERVHRGSQHDGAGHVPRPPDACEAVVAEAHSEFGKCVRVERCDEEEVRPLSQFDMQNWVATLVSFPKPLVRIADQPCAKWH